MQAQVILLVLLRMDLAYKYSMKGGNTLVDVLVNNSINNYCSKNSDYNVNLYK